MNIFVLHEDQKICARYHCDKHVVKMITETAQMLSTALALHGHDHPYRVAYQHHPCTVWTAESLQNYQWLLCLGLALYGEYQHRYGRDRIHKAGAVIELLPRFPRMPGEGVTPFAQAMPEQYRHQKAVKAYRAYYLGEKSHLLTYTNRKLPRFVKR